MLNAAVVGLGHMGVHHAIEVLHHPLCHLMNVVEIQEKRVHDFFMSENLSDSRQATFEEIIKNEAVEIVCIASYDDAHFDQVMSCLKAQKHVFVEKPLCQTYEQLQEIVFAYTRTSSSLVSNLVLRTSPLYLYLKHLIETGQLGEIYAFDGDYLYGRIDKITHEWRKDVLNYSVMAGGGIHMIDLMLWLTGERPVSVFSQVNKITTKNTQFRYHDFHSAVFSFQSGMIGRIIANFGCVHPHQHVVRVFGTKGTFIYDDQGARIYWRMNSLSPAEMLYQSPKPAKKTILLKQFVEDIAHEKQKKQKKWFHAAQKEFDLMSVVLAADKSINQQVSVRYLSC